MKSKNIILVLTIILSFCIMCPTVLVQATPGNSSDSLPTGEPESEENLEKDPDPELPPEPVEPEEPFIPKPEESPEEKPDSSSDTKDEQEDKESNQQKEPKENSEDNNVPRENEKPSTSNNNSNHNNNFSPSESSWERPSSNRSNSSSNSTWQESQNSEENVTERMEVLEEEKTVSGAWTLEEMLANNAWVSVVDGIYYAIIGEEQREITEEVAITLGYEPEAEVDEPEPQGNDFVEAYHLAMYNKGIEKLPLNDPEYELEWLAQSDYEEASEQVVASNIELDAFSKQKILAFSVLGIAAVMLVVIYIVKRRRT